MEVIGIAVAVVIGFILGAAFAFVLGYMFTRGSMVAKIRTYLKLKGGSIYGSKTKQKRNDNITRH